jgi:hypothetical protein
MWLKVETTQQLEVKISLLGIEENLPTGIGAYVRP